MNWRLKGCSECDVRSFYNALRGTCAVSLPWKSINVLSIQCGSPLYGR